MDEQLDLSITNASIQVILGKLIRAHDVDGVRRLVATVSSTPGYRIPESAIPIAHRAGHAFQGASLHDAPADVCRRRARDMLVALVEACDEDALCVRACCHEYLDAQPIIEWSVRGELAAKQWLESGAVTALHHFAWNGDEEAVRIILAHPECTERVVNMGGSDAPEVSSSGDVHYATEYAGDDHNRETPLHLACVRGRSAIVRLFSYATVAALPKTPWPRHLSPGGWAGRHSIMLLLACVGPRPPRDVRNRPTVCGR